MTVKDLREPIFENYYKQIGFTKKVANTLWKKKKMFKFVCY